MVGPYVDRGRPLAAIVFDSLREPIRIGSQTIIGREHKQRRLS